MLQIFYMSSSSSGRQLLLCLAHHVSVVHLIQLMEQLYAHYYQLQPTVYSHLLSFYLRSFCCSGIPSRLPYYTELCFFRLLLAMAVFQNFLVYEDFNGCEEHWSSILQDALLLEFAYCFPHDQTGVMSFGKEDHKGKVPSSSHLFKDTHCKSEL